MLEGDLVYRVVGCAMTVVNVLGHGLRERTYEKALSIELGLQGLRLEHQCRYPVFYREQQIDLYQPDLVVEDRLILELKAVHTLLPEHQGQLINYLRVTGIKVGLLMNFGKPKLEWRRVVLEKERMDPR